MPDRALIVRCDRLIGLRPSLANRYAEPLNAKARDTKFAVLSGWVVPKSYPGLENNGSAAARNYAWAARSRVPPESVRLSCPEAPIQRCGSEVMPGHPERDDLAPNLDAAIEWSR